MQVYIQPSEPELVESVYRLRNMPVSWVAVQFHFSFLPPGMLSQPFLEKAIHAIRGSMEKKMQARRHEGIFICHDGDLIILCSQRSPAEIEEMANAAGLVLPAAPLRDIGRKPCDPLYTIYPLTERFEELFFICARKQYYANAQKQSPWRGLHAQEAIHKSHSLRENRSVPTILIVDDDKFSLALLSGMMKGRYEVLQAETAVEGLQLYSKEVPDLVFLDIALPDTSGHKVMGRIEDMDPESFVVMLSAHSQMDHVRKAVLAGAKGFVTKPFNKSKIEGYVQICMAEREEMRRRQDSA